MEINELLGMLRNVKHSGEGYTARCPAHDDHKNSLSVKVGSNKLLLHCFAGCLHASVVNALGIQNSQLYHSQSPEKSGSTVDECIYAYTDEAGILLYEVVRSKPKKFLQRRPNGSGGYVYNLRGVTQVLFRLPEVLAGIAASKRVLLCEGEKDVLNARPFEEKLSFIATTNNGGAGNFKHSTAKYLHGADVLLVYDNDPAGLSRVHALENLLCGIARTVFVVDLFGDFPDAPLHADLTDYLAFKGDLALNGLTALFDSARTIYSSPEIQEQEDAWSVKPQNRAVSGFINAAYQNIGQAVINASVADLLPLKADILHDSISPNTSSLDFDQNAPDMRQLSNIGQEPHFSCANDTMPLKPQNRAVSGLLKPDCLSIGQAVKNAPSADLQPLKADELQTSNLPTEVLPNVKIYSCENLREYILQSFALEVAKTQSFPCISTGFASLDAQLDGRLYSGLYVVGSVSSMGKTAFCAQMADCIASQGVDVLFFSLEMARFEMVARSLVRELFLSDPVRYANTNVGHIMYSRLPVEEITRISHSYALKIGEYMFMQEGNFNIGVDEIARIASSHINSTKRQPVIFVDYLQVLKSPQSHLTDKQTVDYNVIALKRLSRDYDIPIIAISSFNRSNYSEAVNFSSFKESGAIEYSADFVMGLQARGVQLIADEQENSSASRKISKTTHTAKQAYPRPMEAIILKNRRGAAWATFNLDFYTKQNYFRE